MYLECFILQLLHSQKNCSSLPTSHLTLHHFTPIRHIWCCNCFEGCFKSRYLFHVRVLKTPNFQKGCDRAMAHSFFFFFFSLISGKVIFTRTNNLMRKSWHCGKHSIMLIKNNNIIWSIWWAGLKSQMGHIRPAGCSLFMPVLGSTSTSNIRNVILYYIFFSFFFSTVRCNILLYFYWNLTRNLHKQKRNQTIKPQPRQPLNIKIQTK